MSQTVDGKTVYPDRDLVLEADFAHIHQSPSKNGFVLSLERKQANGYRELVAAFQPGQWYAAWVVD